MPKIVHTPESKAKIAASLTGQKRSEESKANMRAAQRLRYDTKPVSAETRAKLAAALVGKPSPALGAVRTPEMRARAAAKQTGKKMSEETKAKMRTSQQARRAANPVSEETKAKQSASLMGREMSDETKAKMSNARKGKPGYRHTEAQKKAISERFKGTKWSDETREKLSGKNSAHWGKPPRHKPKVMYRGTLMRSTWEAAFAKHCDENDILWVYEPCRFELKTCTYTPDFLLPERECFWEVKGWLDAASQRKSREFRELYPEIPLVVATGPVLKSLGVI